MKQEAAPIRRLSLVEWLGMLTILLLFIVTLLLPTLYHPRATVSEELGQTVEGCGSADFEWLKYPGVKYGIAFRAPKSGVITRMTVQWKKSGNYGAGNRGVFTFELQGNGRDNFPAGLVLAAAVDIHPATAMEDRTDGYLHVPLTATLIAGEIYHLVISNTDPDPRHNWSSPNTLMTRIVPWDGTGNRGEVFQDGVWKPWGSSGWENVFNTTGSNFVSSAHSPTMLTWDDGSTTGDPYYSALVHERACFYGSHRAGEFIDWEQPDVTIKHLGLPVGKLNHPATLYYHLESEDGHELATGAIATAEQIGNQPTWVYVPAAFTLQQGQHYRLWFASPDSTADNCYYQFVPYGDNQPPEWVKCKWGGNTSSYIADTGAGWTAMSGGDMSFSLQPK